MSRIIEYFRSNKLNLLNLLIDIPFCRQTGEFRGKIHSLRKLSTASYEAQQISTIFTCALLISIETQRHMAATLCLKHWPVHNHVRNRWIRKDFTKNSSRMTSRSAGTTLMLEKHVGLSFLLRATCTCRRVYVILSDGLIRSCSWQETLTRFVRNRQIRNVCI